MSFKLLLKSVSYNDHYANYEEGWGIFPSEDAFELQTVEGSSKFESVAQAALFVVNKAMEDVYGRHSRAVHFLATHAPKELDSFIDNSVLQSCFNKLKINVC